MVSSISFAWRDPITDVQMIELVSADGGRLAAGRWDRISAHSLGWVGARDAEGSLIGFVNVAWDGGAHAFLLDTRTRVSHRRRGIGRELVRHAAHHAAMAGCEWLHVDYLPELSTFYLDGCGFRRTEAGLIQLRTEGSSASSVILGL